MRCGCPICPDCRPNKPCALCSGSCVVCRGIVPPGMLAAAPEPEPEPVAEGALAGGTSTGRPMTMLQRATAYWRSDS